MRATFLIVGLSLLLLAGAFHIYIFTLESMRWLEPKTIKAFSIATREEAVVLAPMAFNQGFYNLFLALGMIIGSLIAFSHEVIGLTLMFFAAFSMVGAGLVLALSVKRSRRAAFLQALPPLLGALCTLIGFSIR